MPSIKELMTPQNVGIMIYAEVMPIPGGVLEKVEKAEKAFELLGGAMPERMSKVAPGNVEKTPRARASITRDIVACLSTAPLKMWTPRQIYSAVKAAYPRQTVESLTTILKKNAGKPDMWIVGAGKYGMSGAAKTSRANGPTSEVTANVIPAPAELPGEKGEDRVLKYIQAYPRCTKAILIAAFATSATPIAPNLVGIHLGRLLGNRKGTVKRIVPEGDGGPYYPLPTAAATVPTIPAGASAGVPASA